MKTPSLAEFVHTLRKAQQPLRVHVLDVRPLRHASPILDDRIMEVTRGGSAGMRPRNASVLVVPCE